MKVCSCPEEVPAPTLDYTNFDFKKLEADEAAHVEALKAYLVTIGYTGKNTGRLLHIPHADGHASYMYADRPRASCLIHLPHGDAWHSPYVQHMPQKAVLAQIDMADKRAAFFRERANAK